LDRNDNDQDWSDGAGRPRSLVGSRLGRCKPQQIIGAQEQGGDRLRRVAGVTGSQAVLKPCAFDNACDSTGKIIDRSGNRVFDKRRRPAASTELWLSPWRSAPPG
jgi:hypothetical protein